LTSDQRKKAERIAKEINAQESAGNRHLAEERG